MQTKDSKQAQTPNGVLIKTGAICPSLRLTLLEGMGTCGWSSLLKCTQATQEAATGLAVCPSSLPVHGNSTCECLSGMGDPQGGPWSHVGVVPVADAISAGVVGSDNDEDMLEV